MLEAFAPFIFNLALYVHLLYVLKLFLIFADAISVSALINAGLYGTHLFLFLHHPVKFGSVATKAGVEMLLCSHNTIVADRSFTIFFYRTEPFWFHIRYSFRILIIGVNYSEYFFHHQLLPFDLLD